MRKNKTKAETIDFDGVRYYRYPEAERKSDRRYFRRCGKYLHRAVWQFHNGPIPKGFQVHHKDEDTSNNDVGNLELLTPKQHVAKHITPERTEASRKHIERIRPLTKAWHRSNEGHKWHVEHGKKVAAGKVPVKKECQRCRAKYLVFNPKQQDKYCSSKCRAYARRERGDDDITRICSMCGGEFVINRYARSKCCSRYCGGQLRRRKTDGVQPVG